MPFIVTPDDIAQALLRTDASADNIDRAVDACVALEALTRAQWKTWLSGSDGRSGYRAFSKANKDDSFWNLGLANIGNQVVAYEHELEGWNQIIASRCHNPQPSMVPHDVIAAANANTLLPSASGSTKFLVGAGLVLGTLLLLRK